MDSGAIFSISLQESCLQRRVFVLPIELDIAPKLCKSALKIVERNVIEKLCSFSNQITIRQ